MSFSFPIEEPMRRLLPWTMIVWSPPDGGPLELSLKAVTQRALALPVLSRPQGMQSFPWALGWDG